MIGLSLSRCIQDLIEGKLRLCEVEKIYTRTNALDHEEWEHMVQRYKSKYWSKDPVRAEQTVELLLAQNKITQIASHRADGKRPDLEKTGSHWVEEEDQIKWEEFLFPMSTRVI